ncbi:MAG TPA: MarR family winged helix-turn-helix transcriptional regulator [Stellaceae bacterium]|nr:MarR family winged helix-turn-helix transcriptional regulator [Stellaceae bacterium]
MARAAKQAADELTDSLDFLIRDTRLRLYKFIEGRITRLGIPLRVWFPLRALYRKEGITQRELGRMMGYGDAHAGVIVRVMQRHKLVNRQPSRVDKRRINLYLTPQGKKMARLSLRQISAINARIVAGFSPAEAQALQALLLRAHDNLAGD